MDYRLPKSRRLHKRNEIELLYQHGQTTFKYPIFCRFLWVDKEGDIEDSFRVMVVIAKRKVRKAVDRNRGKRLLREAIRLSQEHIPTKENQVLYFSMEITKFPFPDFNTIEKGVKKILSNIDDSFD